MRGRKPVVPPGFETHEQFVKVLTSKAGAYTTSELSVMFKVKPCTMYKTLVDYGIVTKRARMGRPQKNNPKPPKPPKQKRIVPIRQIEIDCINLINSGKKLREVAVLLGLKSCAHVHSLKKSYEKKVAAALQSD